MMPVMCKFCMFETVNQASLSLEHLCLLNQISLQTEEEYLHLSYAVKPPYFQSRSFKSPKYFELNQKSRQKLHCIAPKIVRLFRVSKIRARVFVPSIR